MTNDWRDRVIHELRSWAECGPIHGSLARKLLVQHGAGACADTYEAEKCLEAAGLVPIIEAGPKPTPSQAAFCGLQFKKHPGYVAGCKEHFGFRRADA